ncbi:putative centrosomal protein [Microtus ochrogaster]|uniref:Putative centrosomal protein n=1 Tax=Microtus ochrogaster TaxID=79684 RepID=A0A8J6GBB9_MICOH|nr:putative centrosomal protein [Microtus ochrogaster]
MPVKPPEEGKIVHPTFQITAFSTSLKNHVMVMDLVKKDWLPSQRRAKVCFIHMCQGLKVAERQVSRYEFLPFVNVNTGYPSPAYVPCAE